MEDKEGNPPKEQKGEQTPPPHLYNVITLLYFYTIIYVCIQKVFLKKFSLCWLAYWVQKWELKSTTLATTFYYGKNIIFGDRWDSNLGSASVIYVTSLFLSSSPKQGQ